jgi:hypothetical protein
LQFSLYSTSLLHTPHELQFVIKTQKYVYNIILTDKAKNPNRFQDIPYKLPHN